eukprot:7259664-Pyramimonas_sp.AAC.1
MEPAGHEQRDHRPRHHPEGGPLASTNAPLASTVCITALQQDQISITWAGADEADEADVCAWGGGASLLVRCWHPGPKPPPSTRLPC